MLRRSSPVPVAHPRGETRRLAGCGTCQIPLGASRNFSAFLALPSVGAGRPSPFPPSGRRECTRAGGSVKRQSSLFLKRATPRRWTAARLFSRRTLALRLLYFSRRREPRTQARRLPHKFRVKPPLRGVTRTQSNGGFEIDHGGDLLSHSLTRAVPSALEGLTSEFGMGSGMAPPT